MQTHDFFLLDPGHEPFATGASRRLPAGEHGCLLLFMSLFVLAGLFITGDVIRQWAHFIILSTNYAEARGQVLGREIESDDGVTYYVTYQFTAGDRLHTVREPVEKATFHSVAEGQSLTVRYARRDPTITTIEPGRLGQLPGISGFCLAWNGFVLLMTILPARELLKRRKLVRGGQRLAAEIVRCSGRRDSDGDWGIEVRFGFRSPQTGVRIEGQASRLRADLEGKPLPPPGTPVHLLYLDDEKYMML